MATREEKLQQLQMITNPALYTQKLIADHSLARLLLEMERLQGPTGETPTDAKLIALIRPLIPQVKDGHTHTDAELIALIRPLIPQVTDGKTPTKAELRKIIIPLIPDALAPIQPTVQELEALIKPLVPTIDHEVIAAGVLTQLINGKYIKPEHIEGVAETIKSVQTLITFLKVGGFRGGGSSTGGFVTLLATQVPNGSISVFTFATATAQPKFLVIDYAQKPAVAANGLVNWTWNNGTKQATLNTVGNQCPPPNEDIYAIE